MFCFKDGERGRGLNGSRNKREEEKEELFHQDVPKNPVIHEEEKGMFDCVAPLTVPVSQINKIGF